MASIRTHTGNRMTILILLITTLRIFLGAILLFSGIAKLMGFSAFISNAVAYQILPILLVKPVSYLIVSAEITLGITLCIGYHSRSSGILASLLFLIFAIAITKVLLQKLPVANCGCANFLFNILETWGFLVSSSPNWKIVFIDVILAAIGFLTACLPQHSYSIDLFIQQE